jgi:hypothetical protein
LNDCPASLALAAAEAGCSSSLPSSSFSSPSAEEEPSVRLLCLYSVFDGLTTTSFFSSFDCIDGSSSSLVDDLDGSVAGSLATSLS